MLPALVLTAGLGRRLDPLTRLRAKPAMPVGEQTLVEHVLGWLRREGVADVVLNLHHRPASITAVVGDGSHLGLRARYSWEQPLLGSAGGPRRALPLLAADAFLIVNGDTLCEMQLDGLVAAHRSSGADVTLGVVPNPAPQHYNGIRADDNGIVTGFAPNGQAEGTWHFVGVQAVAAAAFAPLPDGIPVETIAGFYRQLVAEGRGRIRVWPVAAPFVDVGTPADYLQAALSFGPTRLGMLEPAATVDVIRETVVWRDATVERGADLSRAIVAGPVIVPRGLRARDVVIVPADVLGEDDRADRQGDVAIFPLR
jgi:NDP-sugar pyrophosphorylase family protein